MSREELLRKAGRRHAIEERDVARIYGPGHWGKPLVWKGTFPISNGFEVGIAGYDATTFPEQKTHTDDEALYIIEGEGILLLGEEEVPLRAGTAVYIPPRTPHCIKRTKGSLRAVYCHSGQEVTE